MDGVITKEGRVVRPLHLKSFDVERGLLAAYVTTFGNADLVGDVVKEGALDGWIEKFQEEGAPLPMLWEHQRAEIIGEWTDFVADEKGVLGTGELYSGVRRAEDVKVYLARGAVGSVSIGFTSKAFEAMEDGGLSFNEIELRECSIVVAPANPEAKIVSAKNTDGEIDVRKLEVALRDAGLSHRQAKAFISEGKSALREEEVDGMAEILTFLESR